MSLEGHGTGRRCPGCGSYAAAAKANGNRRLGREARKKVVDHLKAEGLLDTAAAIQAAPPSVLQEFMEGLGIDPEILGKTPMPSTHSNPPSAKLLIAQAKAEREKLAGPKITAAQAALAAAEENVTAVDAEADEARKAVNRYRSACARPRRHWRRGPDLPRRSLNSSSRSTTPRPPTSTPNAASSRSATTSQPRSSACATT